MATVTSAPNYTLHREIVTAADGDVTIAAQGVNMHGYEKLHVQVIPDGGDTSVEVLVWSDQVGKYISCHTPLAFAGLGVDIPFEFTVDAYGRQMFVAVTTITAGSANVYIAGWHE